jgi:hypothetical protein
MRESTVLWFALLHLLVLIAIAAIGELVSPRLACFSLGCLGAVQFITGCQAHIISFLPVIGRTRADARRNPWLFRVASLTHACLTLALLVLPILSWLHLMEVSFFS